MRISLSQAVTFLRSGQVVAVPTETVYGMAACLDQLEAIEKIFLLKGRPRANPLIIHMADAHSIEQYVQFFPSGFEELAKTFWPGPLTCILPVQAHIPSIVRAGLPTSGFRVPGFALTRELIQKVGPLVMPSANLSGRPSATSAAHVEEDFGSDFPVLDGGICEKGMESTILLYQESEWVIVRLGAIPPEAFVPILGYEPRFVENKEGVRPLCPGQLFRHYAPKAKLILSGDFAKFSVVVGFKERRYSMDKRVFLLGSLFCPEEVAENLYDVLRQLDQQGVAEAWVDMNFPRQGLWLTIAERLLRAGEH